MTPKGITQIVLAEFGVTRSELRNLSVRREIVSKARATLCYAIRMAARWSYPRIGRYVGCGHDSALRACQRISRELSGERRKLKVEHRTLIYFVLQRAEISHE